MYKIDTMKDMPHVYIVVQDDVIKKYAYSEEEAQEWIDNQKD